MALDISLSGIRFVFLDRDGVINRKLPEHRFISHWDDFQFLAGAEQAIALLNQSGRKVIVITNQRGIALGLYTSQDLAILHARMSDHLRRYNAHVDAIYFCPHDREECECRKPKTGMFLQAFRDFPAANSQNSMLIGDSSSDIEAGNRLGLPTIFIEGSPATQKPGAQRAAESATATASSLQDCVERYFANSPSQ